MKADPSSTEHRTELQKIRTFPALVRYLRDEMGWPIGTGDFEELRRRK